MNWWSLGGTFRKTISENSRKIWIPGKNVFIQLWSKWEIVSALGKSNITFYVVFFEKCLLVIHVGHLEKIETGSHDIPVFW